MILSTNAIPFLPSHAHQASPLKRATRNTIANAPLSITPSQVLLSPIHYQPLASGIFLTSQCGVSKAKVEKMEEKVGELQGKSRRYSKSSRRTFEKTPRVFRKSPSFFLIPHISSSAPSEIVDNLMPKIRIELREEARKERRKSLSLQL